MSTNYYLICEEAKLALEVGHRSAGNEPYLFDSPAHISDLMAFLLEHQSKTLRFVSEHGVDDLLHQDIGWKEVLAR